MKILDLTNQSPVPQIKNSYKIIFTCSQCNSKSERTGKTYLKYGAICINCRNENRYAESRFHSKNEFYISIALYNFSKKIPQHWKFWYYCVDCGISVHRKGQHFNYKFLCENCSKKKTSLERYGVENHAQLPEMREKTKLLFKEKKEQIQQKRIETCLTKYGLVHNNSKEATEKRKQTIKQRYGINPLCSKEALEKARQTCLLKYGEEYSTRLPAFRAANFSTYKYNNLYFDSSWELAFYIYNTDLNGKIEREPEKLTYYFNDAKHYYFPDFKIDNQLFEIKSPYLYSKLLIPNTLENAKLNCMVENNVTIITDCSKYLTYIKAKYGKNFLNSFKVHLQK